MRSFLAALLAAPLLASPLVLGACSAEPAARSASAESQASAESAPVESAPVESAPVESATAEPPASAEPEPAPTGTPSRPSAQGMATDRLADAVLEQLKIDSADTFSDQLITIALSPLMRQLASTADITTRVESDGPKVRLTMKGTDSTCVITVTDEPRARGVVCKQV